VRGWLKQSGIIVALIKPQFEAGKDQVGKRGVVRDPHVHKQVLRSVYEGASTSDLYLHGLILSPLKGPKGNIEFLALFKQESTSMDVDDLISSVIPSNPPQNGN
jgi:23S rRNA (cytidine1920-2'-O)/16S rRNA (cytidine1409-2'-O)-methyltransferase